MLTTFQAAMYFSTQVVTHVLSLLLKELPGLGMHLSKQFSLLFCDAGSRQSVSRGSRSSGGGCGCGCSGGGRQQQRRQQPTGAVVDVPP